MAAEISPEVLTKLKETFTNLTEDECMKISVEDEMVDLAVKTVPFIIEENNKLNQELIQCRIEMEEKDREIIRQSESFHGKDIEHKLLTAEEKHESKLAKEHEEDLKVINEVKESQDKLLEALVSNEDYLKPTFEELKEYSENTNVNVDRLFEILENRAKNVVCKIKTLQKLEKGPCSIAFFGSKDSMKHVMNKSGQLGKDMNNLKNKKKITSNETVETGSENLITLLKTKDTIQEMETVAVIVLNFTAEVASFLLEDGESAKLTASQIGLYCKKMMDVAKDQYKRIIFVLPAATTKSYNLVNKVVESVKSSVGNATVIDLCEIQCSMGESCENKEQTFEVSGKSLLKRFVISERSKKEVEGYNDFATNCLVTKVIEDVLEEGKTSDLCAVCCFGHSSSGESCYKENTIQFEDDRDKPIDVEIGEVFEKNQESEECLKCFRSHPTEYCPIKESVRCYYPGCSVPKDLRHYKAVHYPNKKETITRLKKEYGSKFGCIISPSSMSTKKRGMDDIVGNSKKGKIFG